MPPASPVSSAPSKRTTPGGPQGPTDTGRSRTALSTPEPGSHFVGFSSLEEFGAACDIHRPVYTLPIVLSGGQQDGLHVDSLLIVCQQVTPDGHVLYCRLKAACLTRLWGEPFDSDWQERQAAWLELSELVESFLREVLELTLVRATVAMPNFLVPLQGCFKSVRFDTATKRYVRRSSASSDEEGVLAC
jgi:hypothetical protein